MQRKQLKRTKGFRMLPNSRAVTRSSRWGNPYRVQMWFEVIGYTITDARTGKTLASSGDPWTKEQATQKAVELFRSYATDRLAREPEWLDPLRGLDYLYCWCPEDAEWCHCDVIIELIADAERDERAVNAWVRERM